MWRVMAQIMSFFFVVLDFFKMNYDTNNDELRYKLYNFFYNTRLFQGSYDTNCFFFFFFFSRLFQTVHTFTLEHPPLPHLSDTQKKNSLFPISSPKVLSSETEREKKGFFWLKRSCQIPKYPDINFFPYNLLFLSLDS